MNGLKNGILLEAGFDNTAPSIPVSVTSWVMEYIRSIKQENNFIDNTAKNIKCFDPRYTFVEKVQTILSKYIKGLDDNFQNSSNFMRQYYDVYCLLNYQPVQDFLNTEAYLNYKSNRIKGQDSKTELYLHPALTFNDKELVEIFKSKYIETRNLYYTNQPDFDEIIIQIKKYIGKM